MDIDRMVFACAKKEVGAIDASSGETVWKEKLDELVGGYATMTLHETTLIVAHKDSVYAFDALSGTRLWKRKPIAAKGGPTMLLSGAASLDAQLAAQVHMQVARSRKDKEQSG